MLDLTTLLSHKLRMVQNILNILKRIADIDHAGVLAPFLEQNTKEFCARHGKPFQMAEITDWSHASGLDTASQEAVADMAKTVLADPCLSLLYFHCSRLAYETPRIYPSENFKQWPTFDMLCNNSGNLFLLLIALSAVPKIRAIHKMQGVPDEITLDTCSDIASRIETFRTFNGGKTGVSLTCLNWLRSHATGRVFQMGRLQFHPVILEEPFRAYQHMENRNILILAEPGQRFTSDGFYDGAGGILHDDAWISVWSEKDGMITANGFAVNGRAEKKPVTIDSRKWKLAADRSSVVMNTHIPRGKRITIEDWDDSVRRGFDFFRNILKAAPRFAACACKSWMFDPRLQELLPATSGLIALQHHVHLFPLCSGADRYGLQFIFGDQKTELATAPRDTSLRRAVIDHLSRGGALSGGGMLQFATDIPDSR